MAQQVIGIGTSANDGTGDSLRVGGEKINENFTELYAVVATLYNVDILSVSTAGATITLDFASEEERIFVGSASFATAKAIALSNSGSAKRLYILFDITNVAAKLTFPSGFIMSDVRWEAVNPQEWEPADIGKYKATATYDGTSWWLEISASPYV